jgi:hypothetical protein
MVPLRKVHTAARRKRSLFFTVVTLIVVMVCPEVSAKTRQLRVGSDIFGFHMPKRLNGTVILVGTPTNEHRFHVITDMLSTFTDSFDIAVYETANVNNAFAVIEGKKKSARRTIIFDDRWMISQLSESADYSVLLAHELGHHACGHTLERFGKSPHEVELEADRAAGAILRRVFNGGGGLGNLTVNLDNVKASATAYMRSSTSESHPAGEQRIAAVLEGWDKGSPCLEKYVPINPQRRYSLIESIAYTFKSDVWSHRGARVKAEIKGERVRVTLQSLAGEFIGSSAQRGDVVFEGLADEESIRGTYRLYLSSCNGPLTYAVTGQRFLGPRTFFLVGQVRGSQDCRPGLDENLLLTFDNAGSGR